VTLGSRLSALGSDRYVENITRTTHAVLESPGSTRPELRWAIFHRRADDIPADLRAYVEKVAQHAYRVTDQDVEALKRAGYSEDAIFEVTASAALGAAIMRLERGLIAVKESAS
jgi:alkylhydroperoxidase family enzyme